MDLSLNMYYLFTQLIQLAYEIDHISDIKIRSSTKGNDTVVEGGWPRMQEQPGSSARFD